MYVKIMLTLFVLATAILALVMGHSAPPAAAVVPPASFNSVLGTVIDSIEITDMPVERAVRAIRDKTGVDIQVAWESFENATPPLLRTQAVTLSLRHVTLEEALHAVLGRYAWFDAFGKQVNVSGNGARTSFHMVVRAYDVRDLLSDKYWGVKTPAGEFEAVRTERMDDLRSLVREYIDSGESNDPFSGVAAGEHVESLAGLLIVTQTAVGHQKTANLLAWLRKLR
jgi:hypothetical protein